MPAGESLPRLLNRAVLYSTPSGVSGGNALHGRCYG